MKFIAACALALAAAVQTPAGPSPYRTLDDRFDPPHYATVDAWKPRAAYPCRLA